MDTTNPKGTRPPREEQKPKKDEGRIGKHRILLSSYIGQPAQIARFLDCWLSAQSLTGHWRQACCLVHDFVYPGDDLS